LREILDENFVDTLEKICFDAELGEFDFNIIRPMHKEFLRVNNRQIMIANNVYNTIKDKKYYPNLSENITFEALAIDEMRRQGVLCEGWERLDFKDIVSKL
jgi:hypothetical protein